MVPADTVKNFSVVVRGVGFGAPATQPSDLICRLKVPDFEAAEAGPTGPARVINDTAIACSLTGYLTYGVYGIAVESASHSDPVKHIWWSHGTSAIQCAGQLAPPTRSAEPKTCQPATRSQPRISPRTAAAPPTFCL